MIRGRLRAGVNILELVFLELFLSVWAGGISIFVSCSQDISELLRLLLK
jgi:hypothetical protein